MGHSILIASQHPYARNVLAEELVIAGHHVRLGDPDPHMQDVYDLVLVSPQQTVAANGPVARLICWDGDSGTSDSSLPMIDVDRPLDAILGDIEAAASGKPLPGPVRETEWSRARQRVAQRPGVWGLAKKIQTVFGTPVGESDEGFRKALNRYLTELR